MSKSLILLVGGVLAVGAVAMYWNSQNVAPGHSMTPPDTTQLAQGDPIAVVSIPEELSSNARIGQRGYEAKCAACHGANAAGQNGVAPPLVHKIYEPSHHGDMAFVLAAQNGVRSHHWRFGNMPPVEGLTRADVMNIVEYIRTLQRENGIN